MAKVDLDENKIDINQEDFDEVQAMLIDIKYCFQICMQQNVEMITFTH